jgi:hypothetical protein
MSNKKKILIIGLIVCVLAIAGSAVAYVKLSERGKDKAQIEIVNKYLKAYRTPDLAAVKDVVSEEMKTSLPEDQKAFKGMVERADKSKGRIKDWSIIGSDTNQYVGQTMVGVTVNTTKTSYEVVFDISGDDKQGWKIRAVKDMKADQSSTPNMGGMGGQTAPGNHGMQ